MKLIKIEALLFAVFFSMWIYGQENKEILEKICGSKTCYLAQIYDAGQNNRGEAIRVYEVVYGPKPKVNWHEPFWGEEEALRGYEARDELPCIPYGYWMGLHQKEGWHFQKILDLCNEGYGAAAIGEDQIQIGNNRFDWTQTGGSSWLWSNQYEIRLSPPLLLNQESSSSWIMGNQYEEDAWDWQTWIGETVWYTPICNEDGTLPDLTEEEIENSPTWTYLKIPFMPTPPWIQNWKDLELGTCSILIDAQGQDHGYLVFGKPNTHASFKIVGIQPSTLLIEVQDDHWVTGSKSWLYDDHLEIWWNADRLIGDDCIDPQSAKLYQWGIRISDGKVFAAYGKPKELPKVERIQTPKGVRFKINMPFVDFKEDWISVIYSDSDHGQHQDALIGTSPLKFKRPETLGKVQWITYPEVQCIPQKGVLKRKGVPKLKNEKALIGDLPL